MAMVHKRAKDYDQALQILKKAAKMGYNAAYYGLGKMYYKGQGVPQDKQKARVYYKKACNKGDRAGCGVLDLYKDGIIK